MEKINWKIVKKTAFRTFLIILIGAIISSALRFLFNLPETLHFIIIFAYLIIVSPFIFKEK